MKNLINLVRYYKKIKTEISKEVNIIWLFKIETTLNFRSKQEVIEFAEEFNIPVNKSEYKNILIRKIISYLK
jgi:predicted transcriptional regulator